MRSCGAHGSALHDECIDVTGDGIVDLAAGGLPAVRMRVGIHAGPVVAGIVGVKMFQCDILDDTVNTTSRMESSDEVGQVDISEATYRLVNGEE